MRTPPGACGGWVCCLQLCEPCFWFEPLYSTSCNCLSHLALMSRAVLRLKSFSAPWPYLGAASACWAWTASSRSGASSWGGACSRTKSRSSSLPNLWKIWTLTLQLLLLLIVVYNVRRLLRGEFLQIDGGLNLPETIDVHGVLLSQWMNYMSGTLIFSRSSIIRFCLIKFHIFLKLFICWNIINYKHNSKYKFKNELIRIRSLTKHPIF